MQGIEHAWAESGRWQPLLDALDCPAGAHGAIGLLRGADYALGSGTLLVWQAVDGAWRAAARDYAGSIDPDLSLLLVADEPALQRLLREGAGCVAPLVSRGGLRPFILRTLDELEAAGLADFVEDLGLVFPKH